MGVYISKNAMQHNPFNTTDAALDQKKESRLRSELLLSEPYLVQLNRNDKNVKPLGPDNNGPGTYRAITVLKVALNLISFSQENSFNLPIPTEYFSVTPESNPGIYDQDMVASVTAFQQFAGIAQTGIVNATTLQRIDRLILPEVISNLNNLQQTGLLDDKSIAVIEEIDAQGNYNYIITIDGESFGFSLPQPLQARQYLIPSTNTENNPIYFANTHQIKERIILENELELEENRARLEKVLDATTYQLENPNAHPLSQTGIPLSETTINTEKNKIPSSPFTGEMAELHLVQSEEDLINIIQTVYYDTEETFVNPFTPEGQDPVIFTLPQRELSPVSERQNDIRLQFYLNLIYYYNTQENGDGTIEEFGIKKANGYTRYDDNDLNDFYMYDHTFDPVNPDSVLPNYDRFLKSRKSFNPASEILFDPETGQPLSFELDEGQYLWLPSRKFADSLFYQLNFRPSEMIRPDGEYIEVGEVVTTFQTEDDSLWGSFSDWVRDTAKEIYEETVDFFTKAYQFAIAGLTEFPRGWGGRLGAELGVTWGYPIATDVKANKTIWRKMTAHDEVVFKLREEVEVFLGLDTGVSIEFGFKSGSGKKKKSTGIILGGSVEAGIRPNALLEYEFPVRREETAVVALITMAFGSGNAMMASTFLNTLAGINLDPRQYLTWMRYTLPVEADVDVGAQAGFNATSGNLDQEKGFKKPNNYNPSSVESRDKNDLDIENIPHKLAIGVAANGFLSMGQEFEYRAKYDNNPLVPEINGRVPSETEFQLVYFINGGITSGANSLGGFLQRFFLNLTIECLVPFLNVEFGYQLGFHSKFTREVSGRDFDPTQADFSGITAPSQVTITENNGRMVLRKNGAETHGQLEQLLLISKFKGDVDALFITGNETTLKINAYKVYQALANNSTFSWANLEAVLGLLHSIEFQYKQGLGYDRTLRKGLAQTTSAELGKARMGQESDFFKRINSRGIDTFAGTYVKLELGVQTLSDILGYFFKRWYLKIVNSNLDDSQGQGWNSISQIIENKQSSLKRNISLSDQECPEFYLQYYNDLNDFMSNSGQDFSEQLQNADFTSTGQEFIRLLKSMVDYLEQAAIIIHQLDAGTIIEDLQEQWGDFEVKEFIKALQVVAQALDAAFFVEAKLGYKLGAGFKAGLGAKVRIALMGEAAIVFRPEFMEDGQFVTIKPDDPLKNLLQQLKELTDLSTANQRLDGIRQSIINLPR